MVRPVAFVVLILAVFVVAGGVIWYSSIPRATGWCEKGQPGDEPSAIIRNPEIISPETASVRMVANTLVIDTVGDFIPEGRKATVQFEMLNNGLGHAKGATLVRSPNNAWAYKVNFGAVIAENSEFDFCAGFLVVVTIEILDNTPGTIRLVDENGAFVGPAQIQINVS